MPYIKQEDRKNLDTLKKYPINAGELNYFLHNVMRIYVEDNGESYQTYNDIVGVLECAKLELYRRRISKYEEDKAKLNGDIDFYSPQIPQAPTHTVFMHTRKGYDGGVVFSGSKSECVRYCEEQGYPAEYCDPENGSYGDEDEHLEIISL